MRTRCKRFIIIDEWSLFLFSYLFFIFSPVPGISAELKGSCHRHKCLHIDKSSPVPGISAELKGSCHRHKCLYIDISSPVPGISAELKVSCHRHKRLHIDISSPVPGISAELKGSCHRRKCLHLFSESEAYREQMGPIPSSNGSLDIALSNAHT